MGEKGEEVFTVNVEAMLSGGGRGGQGAAFEVKPGWFLGGLEYAAYNVGALPAVLFTIRLKWAEWVMLKTFCPWCFESTVTIARWR